MNKFMKAASALLVAMSMTLPVFAAPADDAETETKTPIAKFSDINTEDFAWAKPYINSMAQKGLISGYEDGTFRPDNDVTRLEALSLFARAMGANDEANAEIIEMAHTKYDSILKNYGLKWGSDEIVFLMYKGALKKADLDTYLKDDEKDTPMKRYEAAIIITKAMGGEEKALSEMGVVLEYTDAREVPSNAIQYVAYATDAGIMTGMGDGLFSPNTPVKRSQMAVMLSQTVDKTEYSFSKVKINEVDINEKTVTVTLADGEEKTYAYTDDTVMKNMGDEVQPKSLATGVSAVITLSGDVLAQVETISSQPDQTVVGRYVSYASTSGKTTIRVTLDETGESESYECLPDVSVTYDGTPATVRSFTKGDVITLELVNGKIAKITGETKATTVTGAIVEDIDISEGVSITISHGNDEYNGKTYEVSSDVTVKKNDATVGLDSIYKGDKVNITLEYGIITKIVATSSKKVVEGTIKSLTITSPQSTMVIKIKDEEKTYTIPKDVEILINGEEGTLYDFRVNDNVKITLESDAITRIVATATQESSGNIMGVVTGVNTSYGVISIKPDGSEDSKQVFCKDDTTTFVAADGKSKKMKDVKVGQTVDVRGSISNGVFVGKLLVIVSE